MLLHLALPESTTGTLLLTALLLAIPLIFYYDRRLTKTIAGEPPVYPSRIPLLGNTLEYGKHAGEFYAKARNRFGSYAPYTLHLLLHRTYILTSPFHISHIIRQAESFQLYPFFLSLLGPFFGLPRAASNHFLTLIHNPPSPLHTAAEFTRIWIHTRSSNGTFRRDFLRNLEGYLPTLPEEQETGLLRFIGKLIAETNVSLLYGEDATRGYPDMARDMYIWVDALPLLLSPLPSWLVARPAVAARARLQKRLANLLRKPETLSEVARYRIRMLTDAGVDFESAAAFELSVLIALLGNSIPATFWLLAHALEPETHGWLTEEVENTVKKGEDGVLEVSVGKVLNECPRLQSLWQEVLRYYQNSAQGRVVAGPGPQSIPRSKGSTEKLWFQPGATVQIPFRPPVTEETVWGADAGKFRADRFMTEVSKEMRETLRPFGGGTHACAGRKYAEEETRLVVVGMLVGWEVEVMEVGEREEGRKGVPRGKWETLALGVVHPVEDVKVRMRRRGEVRFVE